MERCLLSVDWDYFIDTHNKNLGSRLENNKNIINLWYKRYFQLNESGKNIQNLFQLSPDVNNFWSEIKNHFEFTKDVQVYVSDSHALSYDIAEKNRSNMVYLFDAHSDLGYGGLSSLNFEVNCANWLGKLLKNKVINEADIIYSPYTTEKPEYFKQICRSLNARFIALNDLDKREAISAVHICRSGAWTPPWFDEQFFNFIKDLGILYKIIDCPRRKWDTKHLSFSDRIFYSIA